MGTLATWQLSEKGMMAPLLKSLNNEGEREEKNQPKTMPVIQLCPIPNGKFSKGKICITFYKGML